MESTEKTLLDEQIKIAHYKYIKALLYESDDVDALRATLNQLNNQKQLEVRKLARLGN